MDITLNCAALAPELALCRRVVERKATIPVYAYARLDARDGEVRIMATDGDAAFVTVVSARIKTPGSLLVPVRHLAEIVRAAAADEIRICEEKSRVKVTCGSFAATLGTLPLEDYPIVPEIHGAGVSLVSTALAVALDRVRRVIETDGSMSPRHGAFLEIAPNRAVVAALDGYRLAIAGLPAPADASPLEGLLPRKAVEDLAAILEVASDGEVVDVQRDSRRAYFTLGARLYTCALMEFRFPSHQSYLTKAGGSCAISFDRDAALGVFRRVRLVADQKTVRVDLAITKKKLVATMQNSTVGDAVEELPIALDRGAPCAIAFKVDFIEEFLATVPAGTVSIEIEPDQPAIALFKGAGDYTYLLSPMVKPANSEAA